MSFDMEPDHDEHAACRLEIQHLNTEIERLRAELVFYKEPYRKAMAVAAGAKEE